MVRGSEFRESGSGLKGFGAQGAWGIGGIGG